MHKCTLETRIRVRCGVKLTLRCELQTLKGTATHSTKDHCAHSVQHVLSSIITVIIFLNDHKAIYQFISPFEVFQTLRGDKLSVNVWDHRDSPIIFGLFFFLSHSVLPLSLRAR